MSHIKKTFESFINEEFEQVSEIRRIKDIVRNVNAEIVKETPELLVLRIGDFAAAKKLGSPSWGIVHSERMWSYYVDKYTNQYFVYDFSKSPTDKEYLLGVTVKPGGKIEHAYYQDDTPADLEYVDSLGLD